ncbi:hypothetical protein ACG9YX_00450 [Acinetobacter nematophilus]|uniref:hypothetical protein n=1 Tax=Acinetobacter nematophilus TaxID=2994642 RepID=UPI003AF4E8EF
MNDKKLLNLEMLEQDMWLNFCYYYQCELSEESIVIESQSYIDKKEKIIKRMEQNDFSLSEIVAFRHEMMGETIPFKPFQIAGLLTRINTLRIEVNDLSALIFQRQYSDILIAYVQLIGGLESIKNHKLFRSARATLAVKARYDKHLYRRREIIYRILREQVARRGKWKTLNQAIHFIVDDLIRTFEVYDIQWLKEEFDEKKEILRSLERVKPSVKQVNVERDGVRRRLTTASKEIVDLKKELINLKKILNSKYPSKEMEKFGYKMPYSGGYIAETIIHELRTQPEILQEILFR